MRLRIRSLGGLGALALLLSGCGDSEDAAPAGPAEAMPLETVAYVEVVVKPDEEQLEAIEEFSDSLGELPVLGVPADPQGLLQGLLESEAQKEGLGFDYEEDVEPWLGERIGLGITSFDNPDEPGFIIALETTDEEAALEAIRNLSEESGEELDEAEVAGEEVLRGSDSTGGLMVTDGYVLVGRSDEDLEVALDSLEGESYADSEDLEAVESLDSDRLALGIFDFKAAIELAARVDPASDPATEEAITEAFGDQLDQPTAFSLGVDGDSIDLESVSPTGLSLIGPAVSGTDLLGSAPADAYAAVGFADLPAQIQGALDLFTGIAESTDAPGASEEELSSMLESEVGITLDELTGLAGDAIAFGRGDLPKDPVIGLDIEIADEEAARTLLEYARTSLEESPLNIVRPPLTEGAEGFSVFLAGPDASIRFRNVELSDELATIDFANSSKYLEDNPEPAETLAEDSETYAAALSQIEGLDPGAFVDVEAIADAAVDDKALSSLDPVEREVAEFLLDRVSYFAMGTQIGEDSVLARLSIATD